MDSPAQVPHALPNAKRSGRIRRVLCAIRDFIERLLTPTAIVVGAVLLLVASWIYPPWVTYGRYASHDWYFIFSANTGSMRIDLPRLLLIDLIIAVTSGLLAWAICRNSEARRVAARIVLCSIVILVMALPAVAVVWRSVVLIQNIQRDAAKRAVARWKFFDPATASLIEDYTISPPSTGSARYDKFLDKVLICLGRNPPIRVAIPAHGEHGTKAEFPGGMPLSEIAAVVKKKFFSDNVNSDNLKQIALFDVKLDEYCYKDECKYSFDCKVRNNLPRAVQTLAVKASFYSATGELIEADTFFLDYDGRARKPMGMDVLADDDRDATVAPSVTATFWGSLLLHRLPQGATYRLELVEAHYVPELTDAEFGLQSASPRPTSP